MAREEENLQTMLADMKFRLDRLERRHSTQEGWLEENLRRFGIRGTRGKARLDRSGLQFKTESISSADQATVSWTQEFHADIRSDPPAAPGGTIYGVAGTFVGDYSEVNAIAYSDMSTTTEPFARLTLKADGDSEALTGASLTVANNTNSDGILLVLTAEQVIFVRLRQAGPTDNDVWRINDEGAMALKDGITAPVTASGWASIYVDTADGDLKVKFGDGVTKTIATDS